MTFRLRHKAALAALAAGMLVITPPAGLSPANAVTVSDLTARTNTPGGTLNLRSCAAASCSVLKRVPHGTLLWMTAASGDWFRTTYSGATGWVHSGYTIPQGRTVRTNTPGTTLNLRSCAATSCSVLRRVPHGTLLSITAASGVWYRATYSGATGWVHSGYTVLQSAAASTVTRGNTSRKMVSYTFDAGSDLGYAKQILDFLKANGIKASFGMTGTWATAYPTYVQRMVNEGHHVMNHTWNHPSFTGVSSSTTALTPARRTEQLALLNDKVVALTGKSTKPYFRPPYGDYNSSVLRDVGANGYSRSVMWSVDSLGWKGLTASQICDRVVSAIDGASSGGNGYIVLFHVGSAAKDANALSCMTTRLKDRGFSFGTVPQIIAP